MPEKQKKALVARCQAGELKPQKGRTCEEAAYAIMTAQGTYRTPKKKRRA